MKMKIKVTEEQEKDFKYFCGSINPRYWEDADVNGETDIDYDEQKKGEKPRMPLVVENPEARYGEEKYNWEIKIDLATGNIQGWPEGTTANVLYKVCDQGVYWLEDADGNEVHKIGSYVPSILDFGGDSYGDYIECVIDENGHIKEWDENYVSLLGPRIESFLEDEGF